MSEKQFHVPGVATHLIKSRHVSQTFQIQVMQPLTGNGEDERFPVLYLTEGNGTFPVAKGISHSLQAVGQVRRFILVGIGYPGDNPFASSILRGRDLTPASYPDIPGVAPVSPIDGVPSVEAGTKRLHGGSDFLAFIRDELTVLIDNNYPTIPGERAYFGHSLGGTLGLHALFGQADIFNRYIISSPGLSWDGDDFGIREAQEFVESRQRRDARLFMAVAEQEEFEPMLIKAQFVSNFYRLVAMLLKARIPGLEFSSRVFSAETHTSVWPVAFSHGVRTIYGPADCPPLGIPAWAASSDQPLKATAGKKVVVSSS